MRSPTTSRDHAPPDFTVTERNLAVEIDQVVTRTLARSWDNADDGFVGVFLGGRWRLVFVVAGPGAHEGQQFLEDGDALGVQDEGFLLGGGHGEGVDVGVDDLQDHRRATAAVFRRYMLKPVGEPYDSTVAYIEAHYLVD